MERRRTPDTIKRILQCESLNQPLKMIFEDLHWIDEETQAFLNRLADSIGTSKILLLVNYRPEYSYLWGSKTHYTQLCLDALGKDSAEEMLSALLGDNAELVAVKRVIIEKTKGNSFFMEETVQVLVDEGALLRNGEVHLTRPIPELKIPPTVQEILVARIDRLPQDAEGSLQTHAAPSVTSESLAYRSPLGQVLMITKGWAAPGIERAYLRAQELAEAGGTTERFSLLTGLYVIAFVGGRMREARERQEPIRHFS